MTLAYPPTLPSDRPIGLALAGLGGFAASITDRVRLAAAESDVPPFRLIGVGDPAAGLPAHAPRRALLEGDGTAVVDDFFEALKMPGVDAVWLPLPISLHRPFVEASYAAGKHVICEKPLAGNVSDVDAMIQARDAAGLAGLVGFHDLFHPQTMRIKKRILAGEIGELTGVTVVGSWPRDTTYFQRAPWAGRQMQDGVAVYDSPANNALAHYLMLALFMLGPAPHEAAVPVSVDAKTWRAAPIENFDTVDARFGFGDARSLHLLLSHADRQTYQPQVVLRGTRGTWVWRYEAQAPPVVDADEVFTCPVETRQQLIGAVASLLNGTADDTQPFATFETARAHAVAIEMIQRAGDVMTISPAEIQEIPSGRDNAVFYHVPGMLGALLSSARTGQPLAF